MAVQSCDERSHTAATLTVTASTERSAPSGVGLPWTALDTPALLVDLDRLEANLAAMAAHAERGGVALRPHFKTHKSASIAERQLAAGAVGLTVATLDEAEAVVDAGLAAPILLAFQIVNQPKIDRALRISTRVPLTVAVDSLDGAARLAGAAASAGVVLDVWIEIDSGLRRCGVVPADAPALARAVSGHGSLQLTGMFTHAGQSYAAADAGAVAAIAAAEAAAVVDAAVASRAIGIAIPTVSAGSTPTARFLDGSSGVTEIRPGTYVFYDALQVALGTTTADTCALTVAATVVSRPAPERVVVDAGSKTFGLDKGAHSSDLLREYGTVLGIEASLGRLSEEHGILTVPASSTVAIGDRIRVLPNHVCSVTNLGRRYHAVRGDVVTEVITIDAAGGVH